MTAVDSFTLHIPGRPVGKARPRVGRSGHVYTPKETVLAEQTIRAAWVEAEQPRLEDGAIQLKMVLGVTRPRSHYKTSGDLSAEGLRNPYPHRQKPDVDNALKLIDSINGRAWRDDVQIIDARILRVWADEPYTSIQAWAVRDHVAQLGVAA